MTDGHQGGWQPQAPRAPRPTPPSGPPAFPHPPYVSGDPSSAATPVRPLRDAAPPTPPGPTFDAQGMRSVLTRARDQSRFEAPVIEEERGKRPFPVKGLLATLVGIMVVGIIAGFVYVNYVREVKPDPNVAVQASGSQSVEPIQTPQEVVVEYFKALEAGDIDRAMALGERGGTGLGTLLTPEAYAKTREISPIGNLKVLTDDPTAVEVRVSYTVGEEPVEAAVRLVRLDDGSYRMARTTVTVQLQVVGGQNLPMKINGQSVDHTQLLEVVPGRYELESGLPFIAYPANNNFPINSLSRADPQLLTVNPQLTEIGRSTLMAKARQSLDRCLAQKELTPTGCPNGIIAGQSVNQSTIDWQLLNDPWGRVTPTLSSEDQSIALMSVGLHTNVSFTYANGDRSTSNPYQETVRVRANMLGLTADDVAVVWED